MGAVFAEQHDEWVATRRYLTVGPLEALVQSPPLLEDEEESVAMTA
jgi:hypothetical protein